MSSKPALLQGALWYAAHEIPVLPLRPRNKVPLVRHGVKEGTTDTARIRKWWEECPEANIGVPTGEASGLLVLDCDPRNGGPADRCGLIELFGSIPETAEAITGGGGRHIYFRYAGGRVPKSIARGVDLKSDGGYVVVPPSIHPNGNAYEWDGLADGNALLSLAYPPEWLLKRIITSRNVQDRKSRNDSREWLPGERNIRLTSIAGMMRRCGLSPEAISAGLLEENRRRCNPPLAVDEVRGIAKSMARYPAADIPSRGAFGVLPPEGYDDALSALLDVIRFTADLPGFAVLLFVVERTLGYGKGSDCISISQMVGGVYSPTIATWVRGGCGRSKASVAKAIRSLKASDAPLLLAKRRSSPERGFEPTEYTVNWAELNKLIAQRKGSAAPPLSTGETYKPIRETWCEIA